MDNSYDVNDILKKYNNNIKLKLNWRHNLHKYQNYTYEVSLMYISKYYNVIEALSGLKRIRILNLSNNTFTNVDFLADLDIEYLNLSHCAFLKHVPHIKSLKVINLSKCVNLIDLTSIVNVESINLSNCYHLIDISILKNVSKLNISGCSNIKTDITQFKNLQKLNIAYCDKLIYNINFLQRIKKLVIGCCCENRKQLANAIIYHGNNRSDMKTWCFNCCSNIDRYCDLMLDF